MPASYRPAKKMLLLKETGELAAILYAQFEGNNPFHRGMAMSHQFQKAAVLEEIVSQ